MDNVFVAILMGSANDLPIMQGAADVLGSLGVNCEMKVTSAHRTPAATQQYLADAVSRGCEDFMAGCWPCGWHAPAARRQVHRRAVHWPWAGGR